MDPDPHKISTDPVYRFRTLVFPIDHSALQFNYCNCLALLTCCSYSCVSLILLTPNKRLGGGDGYGQRLLTEPGQLEGGHQPLMGVRSV